MTLFERIQTIWSLPERIHDLEKRQAELAKQVSDCKAESVAGAMLERSQHNAILALERQIEDVRRIATYKAEQQKPGPIRARSWRETLRLTEEEPANAKG